MPNNNNEDERVTKSQNELWFSYFEWLIQEMRSRSLSSSVVSEIFGDELNKRFKISDSALSVFLPKLRRTAFIRAVGFFELCKLVGLALLSFIISFGASSFFNKDNLQVVFLSVFTLFLILYILRLKWGLYLLNGLAEIEKRKYVISWKDPQKLTDIIKFQKK